jgi:hypothetical protein
MNIRSCYGNKLNYKSPLSKHKIIKPDNLNNILIIHIFKQLVKNRRTFRGIILTR